MRGQFIRLLGLVAWFVMTGGYAATPDALECRECHAQIYQEWQTSWMARANSNANFQAHFKRWQSQAAKYPAAVRESQLAPDQCLRCHAPEIDVGGGLKRQDGVTCLTCHGVRKVREEQHGHRLNYDARGVLYGPGKNTGQAPHPLKQGDHFTDSSLCAGCHHDIAPNGIALERTYEEWQSSRYAQQGVQCADCHMPKADGPPSIGSDRREHASHRFMGGHADSPLLKGAAKLALKQQTGQALVTVINQSVGHHFPTGGAHPNKLVLKIELLDASGKQLTSEERVYRYDYLAPGGGMRAPAELIDTTLRPGERREETIAIASDKASRLRARLEYYIVPEKLLKQLPAKDYASVLIDEADLQLEP